MHIAVFVLLVMFGASSAGAESILPERDAALVEEALHLRDTLGDAVWSDWSGHTAPILYKTLEVDVLLDHPAPPPDFRAAVDDALGRAVHVRAQPDSSRYGAAFPFEGHWTVVMSALEPEEDPCGWVLTAVHELFHVHQNRVRAERLINPFVLHRAGTNELNYPFPHDDEAVRSFFALEAELVFRAIGADAVDELTLRRTRSALEHTSRLAGRVFADSLDHRYKQWMEWHEGVARYTERELSRLAADPDRYTPSSAFARAFPEASYAEAWRHWEGQLAPIRFVGEGVRGRSSFYYLGMGKALLLDRVAPRWRDGYFESGLDALIANAASPD